MTKLKSKRAKNLNFKTRVIFSNRKTKYSVDFGICGFMFKDDSGNYSSATCPGCYSAILLNLYPATKRKLEEVTGKLPDMENFKSDIQLIKDTKLRFIRFYSLGDWGNPAENKYIHAAADIMPVEAFSKILHLPQNRNQIIEIAKHDNVNISLSFNKSFNSNYIESVFSFLKANGLLKNVQLNYTFTGDEEIRHIPYISVYHTTSKKKVALAKLLGVNRVCCMKDENGTVLTANLTQNHTGSCVRCALCRLPAANKDSQILTPNLMKAL